MNNTSNADPSQPQDSSQSEGTANPKGSSQQSSCPFETLRSAMNEGAHRAKDAAEKAIPKVKAAVSDATYLLGYGISFAAVFSYIVIKELAPKVLKGGCRDGAQAGQKTAEDLASKFNEQPGAQGATPSTGAASTGPATQPGPA
jgi:hypothetical protein